MVIQTKLVENECLKLHQTCKLVKKQICSLHEIMRFEYGAVKEIAEYCAL